MDRTKVLVVEDEALFRQLVVTTLSAQEDLEVVGEADTGEEAIEVAESLAPDVVLMDIELGGELNGIEAGLAIKTASPATGIVLLSYHDEMQFLTSKLEERPAGWSYLLKQNVKDTEALVRAIKGASWGLVVVDSQLVEDLKPRIDTPLATLNDDQIKTLALMARGFADGVIATKLGLEDTGELNEKLHEIYGALDIPVSGDTDPRVKAVLAYLEQSRSS